jgi:hypothetical protein
MALMKIQLLENEKAEAWGRHPSVPAAKSGASKTGTPGPEGPSLNEEKSGDEPDETNEKKDDPPIVHPDGQPVARLNETHIIKLYGDPFGISSSG